MSFLFKKVAAQDAGNEENLMKSLIDLFNEAKEKGDAKLLDFVKRSWNAAKVKPNYKAMSNNPSYRKLDKIASDEVANDSAADAAPKFKVGDKVKRKDAINGKVYTISAVGSWFGETVYTLSGHIFPYLWHEEHKIVAADSAADAAEITESQLKIHALNFARHEFGKYADELRKKRDSLADLWEKTGIANGAIKSGEYKQADIDEFINPYVNVIEGAMRILERI
jgi:hypothetical protein